MGRSLSPRLALFFSVRSRPTPGTLAGGVGLARLILRDHNAARATAIHGAATVWRSSVGGRSGSKGRPHAASSHRAPYDRIPICRTGFIWPPPHDVSAARQSHPGGDFPTWAEWLAKIGSNCAPGNRGLKINSTAAVIQAAVAGRGLALVRKALVQHELESSRLVHLMPHNHWPVKWAYYVVASAKALRRSEVSAFYEWLVRTKTS